MIALYPGAFKPPHKGHFQVVRSILDGTYNGGVYDKDNYKVKGAKFLDNKSDKKPNISKVIVFAGGGERNGITKEESKAIWEIYAKYIPEVEIMDGGDNPMFAAKDYAKANSDTELYAITGIRGEKDFIDLRRITTFTNTPNVKGLAISNPGFMQRASDLRDLALKGEYEKTREYFPDVINDNEFDKIVSMLKDNIVAEVLSNNIEGFIEEYFQTDESLWANINAKKKAGKKSSHKNSNAYKDAKKAGKALKKSKNENYLVHNFDFTPFMASLIDFMINHGLNITPLPNIILRKDEKEANDFFCKTAHYDGDKKEIVLYVLGRHPKDVMRSFSHEMIHHMQNLDGALKPTGTTNTNQSKYLQEIEKEAYLKGNMMFRTWEDSIKNNMNKLENKENFRILDNKLSSKED
tara:strand:- start:6447 stop:7670 length:1224 start_codon:yes stop_codon:yes gene_type:complete